jgi:hypothetical protein
MRARDILLAALGWLSIFAGWGSVMILIGG